MILNTQERESELWRKLAAHFNELIEKAHKDNEKNIDEVSTSALRGRIKVLRQLIQLGNEPKDKPDI